MANEIWQETIDQSQFCLLLAKLWKKYYMINCIITYPTSICSVIINLVFENFIDCTNDWYTNLDRKMFNLVVQVDLKKAFDTVDHQILLKKL